MTNLVIYTKETCPFCVLSKSLLKENQLAYTEVNITEDGVARKFMQSEGHKTVPQIYKDGTIFVDGGYEGLVEYFKTKNTLGDLSL